jgi:hypothetical protein
MTPEYQGNLTTVRSRCRFFQRLARGSVVAEFALRMPERVWALVLAEWPSIRPT